jgi:EmrB/QacA subfamily drug resistance transporter
MAAAAAARPHMVTGREQLGEERHHKMMVAGLMLGILLASLDQTVVGTSLPRIVAELGGLDRLSWLFSAYMLASTVIIPLAGKLSDRIGRRPVFLVGMGTFLAGSMLCGLAQDMQQLIAFRFVQGMGGGVLFPVAFATVADLYPPSERGKVQGAFGAVFGVSAMLGPLLGGFIVDHTTWRWVFYVNLPVGLAAIAITATHFPRVQPKRSPIDVAGAVLLSGALTTGLLVVIWGGSTYAWQSVQILGLAAVSLLAVVGFVLTERRAPDPIVPLRLFKDPIFALSNGATMLLAMGMFGVIAFLPLFMQAVIGVSATNSALVLTPLMLTVVVGSVVSGKFMMRTGYKVWIVAGPIIAAAGLLLLTRLGTTSSSLEAVSYLLVIGLGLGFTMATYVVAVQNAIDRRDVGVATSTLTLFRSLGGTVGVTILGALLNSRMGVELPARLPAQALALIPPGVTPQQIGETLLRPQLLAGLPPFFVQAVRESLAASLGGVFFAGAVACLLGFAVSVFVKNVPMKTKEQYLAGAGAAATAEGGAPPPTPPVVASPAAFAQAMPAPPVLPAPPPKPAVAPRLVAVRHEPPFWSPGIPVETVARLEAREGAAPGARVEVWVGPRRVAQAVARVPAEGAVVRLRWTAPANGEGVTTSIAPWQP